jgi:hypothetical protein
MGVRILLRSAELHRGVPNQTALGKTVLSLLGRIMLTLGITVQAVGQRLVAWTSNPTEFTYGGRNTTILTRRKDYAISTRTEQYGGRFFCRAACYRANVWCNRNSSIDFG